MNIEFLGIKCADCGDKFIRITQSETDQVVCPTCLAVGDYEDVVKQGAGITRGILVEEETKDFIERLRRRRDAGF